MYMPKEWTREEFRDVVEPIVSDELWTKANQQIKKKIRKKENLS